MTRAKSKAKTVGPEVLNHVIEDGQVVGTPYGGGHSTRSWSDDPERAAKNDAHLKALETVEPGKAAVITLPRLDIRMLQLKLIGDSELICHHWSEKAIKMILDKQMGKASAGREHKDPQKDYEESLYP